MELEELKDFEESEFSEQKISPFYRVKIILAGEGAVGKSTLLGLLTEKNFDPNIPATIGISFASYMTELERFALTKESNLPEYYYEESGKSKFSTKNQVIKGQIWDLAGSARFRSIIKSYIRDADIAFMVYDISDRQSWEDLETWKRDIDLYNRYPDVPLFVLVGNKSDKPPYQVTTEEIKERAEEWNALSYITTCVQSNSYDMIERMMYKCIEYFHEMMVRKNRNKRQIPHHITEEFYMKKRELVDLTGHTRNNFCCFQ